MISAWVRVLVVVMAGGFVLAGSGGTSVRASDKVALVPVKAAPPGDAVDITRLPIGDGRVTQSAVAGNVWACQANFQVRGGTHEGEWFDKANGTFDLTRKPTVDGDVAWPSAISIAVEGEQRVVRGNGLPGHATGTYPITHTDDAFAYDRNPNPIRAQDVMLRLPATPVLAAEPLCVGMGAIGVMLTGSVFYNALDAAGLDGVAHEMQDGCQGHPQGTGQYHYHNLTSCITDPGEGHSALLGYAFDGFGFYGTRGEDGSQLTDAALDECHGHTHVIDWDGRTAVMYHYHATAEYPYTLGCFRGAAVRLPAR
jgi:hypothetical protein